MSNMTPREIVHELDKHIIGQDDAKRAVAIALRNRWRRMQLPEELRNEITPKNILMIGPTGVGKTEIARRLAKLANAPFVKVEATKFTEVGYVGRDVESYSARPGRCCGQDVSRAGDDPVCGLGPRKLRKSASSIYCCRPHAILKTDTGSAHASCCAKNCAKATSTKRKSKWKSAANHAGHGNHGATGHGGNDQPATEHVFQHGHGSRAKPQNAGESGLRSAL